MFSPLEDEPAIEELPEPIPLTPEQIAAQAEADERDRQHQLEWALVVEALNDNSLAVFRAMRRVPERNRAGAGRACSDKLRGGFFPGRPARCRLGH